MSEYYTTPGFRPFFIFPMKRQQNQFCGQFKHISLSGIDKIGNLLLYDWLISYLCIFEILISICWCEIIHELVYGFRNDFFFLHLLFMKWFYLNASHIFSTFYYPFHHQKNFELPFKVLPTSLSFTFNHLL